MSKRSDKQSKTPTVAQSAAQPANDIIHGRFTEVDWNNLIELESGTEFALDIVDEIIDGALSIIYENYLQKQVVPYVMDNVKAEIMDVVQCQFLARDDGEDRPEFDRSWLEDEEPLASTVDSWAQGSVPSKQPIIESPIPTEVGTSATEVTDTESIEVLSTVTPHEEVESVVVKEDIEVKKIKVKPEKPKEKKKLKVRRYRGKVPTWKTIEPKPGVDLLEGDDDSDINTKRSGTFEPRPAILKVQQGRPPGMKDVTYDEKGNVIHVVKLTVDTLPTHRIGPKYKIIDPSHEIEAAARMKALRMGKVGNVRKEAHQIKQLARTGAVTSKLAVDSIVHARVAKEKALELEKDRERTSSPIDPDKLALQSSEKMQNITALPLSLVDTMELSPGVVIKDGDRIKRGLRQTHRKTNMSATSQHSIKNKVDFKNDYIIRTTPVIKPLSSTPPLTPINATSTYQDN
ncbi:Uncharacterized protein C2orf81-like protein [Trichoplax sp. H2]|uniref:Uncharacterized protein n=1 Tax=Trichoplax adhaerens TaxID=10228 RepID=B3S6R2_TRIAD|nr:hypothetical protein TRIADDRAFT_59896 [Trichoplax adhaerens]EDV21664.1 hypothetical protein TRIADDRAFT_59896 [Trichoplax adhaerens]RDD36708.1 Uncharacterized protein C2orf81-like protein [Trichoplax sp. H2]|eukprot:XP_002115812.1 hypothetical protein TRIADDRAFT_59896 [Trichoplax adhaerens]